MKKVILTYLSTLLILYVSENNHMKIQWHYSLPLHIFVSIHRQVVFKYSNKCKCIEYDSEETKFLPLVDQGQNAMMLSMV